MDRQAPQLQGSPQRLVPGGSALVRTAVSGWGPHRNPSRPERPLPWEAGHQERRAAAPSHLGPAPGGGRPCIQNGAGSEP